jgi:hypothetical protein
LSGDDFDAEDKGDPTPLVVLPAGRPSGLAFAPLLGLRAVVVVQVGSSAVELNEDEMRQLEEPYIPHAVSGHR